MHSKKLIELLTSDGWVLGRTRGSHHIFIHRTKDEHICIPHPKKDLGLGLVEKILKQADIKRGNK
jgi:predicted RNA binding protein YcfA (HicA-like mRNA interferase family)